MHVQYRYVLDKCRELAPSPDAVILDYGCGGGEIVMAGRAAHLNFHGVDIFYAGNDAMEKVRERGLYGKEVLQIEDGRIPHPDNRFDLVVSNQVFEHVEDMEGVLSEIHRVLKPGGRLLCLFPSREVIREGHCGVAFAHWFPSGSKAQYAWLLLFRCLGFGYHTKGPSRKVWARQFAEFFVKYTHYRSWRELRRLFLARFESLQQNEEDLVRHRLEHKGLRFLAAFSGSPFVRPLSRFACRRMGTMVLILTKGRNGAGA